MLDPKLRELLLDGLRPPQGSQLEIAVATTFTLDLEAALLPPLAFTSYGLVDGTKDPVVLMESIRRATDRVTIFCQAGMIGVPQRAPDLVTFLEPMIQQVAPPGGGLFHPKTWLLKFVDESGTPAYRLLVMSRNLTHDSSWDLVVRLDSLDVAQTNQETNEGLHSFTRSLADQPGLPIERRDAIAALAREVRRVEWERPARIDSLTFHHLEPGSSPLSWTATRACVISPFVNDSGIQAVTDAARERYVVARSGQLDLLSPEVVSGIQTYVLDPAAGLAPADEEEDFTAPREPSSQLTGMSADLHAKMYVLEPAGSAWSKARVLIGSANATSSALDNNIEVLVEMVGHKREFGIDAVLGEEAPLRPLIREYPTQGGETLSERDDLEAKVESLVRRIAALQHSVTVEPAADGEHTLTLTVDGNYPKPYDWDCQVGLLTRPGREVRVDLGMSPRIEFADVSTADVTAFVTIRVSAQMGVTASTVVVASLVNAPQDRLDHVIARQIDSPDKLLRLIHMLLDFGNPATLAALASSGDGASDGVWQAGQAGELEMVLRALATNPESIDQLDDLLRRLDSTAAGKGVIPPDWMVFWETVREARKQVTS